jgi:hypothetical protein
MTPERFRTIVEAYGADARRWPDAERDAAREYAAQHRAEADALLAQSATLDAWLDADRLAPARAELFDRIVASAPSPRPWMFWRRPRMRWSGFAAAGVGVGLVGGFAGALAVSFFVLTATPTATHESSYMTTGFGGPTSEWSDE